MRAYFILIVVHAGCGVDLGPCDPDRARAVVHDEQGVPAYEGQALVQVSCGNGAFCHAAAAAGRERFGAPAGLDFDLHLAAVRASPDPNDVARLARGVSILRDWKEEMYTEVESGTMPPFGEATLSSHRGAQRYFRMDGRRLPHVDSHEGLDALRNWLSCNAPVVERTEGDVRVGDLEMLGGSVPLEPSFASLFANLFFPRCGLGCHSPADGHELARSGLDLSEATAAYDGLVNAETRGQSCTGTGVRLVTPGSPEQSLLIEKLRGNPSCGEPMPFGTSGLPESTVQVVAQWIALGAAR